MTEQAIHTWPRALGLWCLFVLLLVVGCEGDRSTLTEAELNRIAIADKVELVEQAGGLVLIIAGETITSDEVLEAPADPYGTDASLAQLLKPAAQESTFEQFAEQAKRPVQEVVIGKISGILLYQHAKKEASDKADEAVQKMAEKELRMFVLKYGGDQAKADEALREMGMDRKKFVAEQKKVIITQSYLASKLQYRKPVSYGELVEYYEKVKDDLFFTPAVLRFRLIDIEVARMEVSGPNQERAEEARMLASKLAERIRDSNDFDAVAREYSNNRAVVHRAVEVSSLESLDEAYDVLAEHVEAGQPGEIAGPIISETGEHIFIMKLEEKQAGGYEPLEEVQREIHNRILVDRRNDAIRRLNAKLFRQAAIGDTDEFVDFCVEKIYDLSRQENTAAAK